MRLCVRIVLSCGVDLFADFRAFCDRIPVMGFGTIGGRALSDSGRE